MDNSGLQYWAEVVFRRGGVIVQVSLTVLAIVFLGSLLWPPLYESKAEILVQGNRAQLLVSPGFQEATTSQPTVVTGVVNEQDLNSEAELLTSHTLIRGALDDLPLPDRSSWIQVLSAPAQALLKLPANGYAIIHDVPGDDPRDIWALEIARGLSASVIKRSNIIEMRFRANGSQWPRQLLTRLLDRYMELHARISQDSQAEKFFETQASILKDKLQGSEQILSAMQLQTGIANVAEQKQALIDQISDLQTDYRKTFAQRASVEQQIESIKGELRQTPDRLTKESRVVQNMALQQLKPQVLQMEAERAELLTRYKPDSERVREIDAKLGAAKKILAHEAGTEVQETTNDLNPVWISMRSELAQQSANAAALKAGQDALEKQLQLGRQELNSMTTDGLTIERMQREVETSKEAYLSYLRKGEEARAAGALNQSKILNVSVVEWPSESFRPVFPNLKVNALAGAVLALLIGVAAAWWEESSDPRVHSVHDLGASMGLPVVAVVDDLVE